LNGVRLLYSTQPLLAVRINRDFYANKHYVYCAPFFNDRTRGVAQPPQPSSSNPFVLWRDFGEAVRRNDPQAAVVKINRLGLKAGVVAKLTQGVIDRPTASHIDAIIDSAGAIYFQPLVLVIPVSLVEAVVERVPLVAKPNPLSEEFLVRELPGDCFEILEFN